MSGENESVIDKRWEEFAEIARHYLNNLKLHKIQIDDDVQAILNMTAKTFSILGAEDCLVYAFLLDKYALVIQSEINANSAKLSWAKHNLDVSVGHLLATSSWGTQYTKYEEKRLMIVSENTYCRALNQMVLEASSIIHYLEGISYKISAVAKTLKDIAYNKRKGE